MRSSACVVISASIVILAACGGKLGGDGSPSAPPGNVPTPADAGSVDDVSASCTSTDCDPHNCGAAGHDCLGAACVQGLCAPLQLASTVADDIAVDDTNVYFVDFDGIYGVSKDGGATFDVARSVLSLPLSPDARVTRMALAGGTAYRAAAAFGYYASGHHGSVTDVESAPVSARGTAAMALSSMSDVWPLRALGVHGAMLYGMGECGNTYGVPIAGGRRTQVSSGLCNISSNAGMTEASGAIDVEDGYLFVGYTWPVNVVQRVHLADGATMEIPLFGIDLAADGGSRAGGATNVAVGGGTLYTLVWDQNRYATLTASGLDGSNARTVAHPDVRDANLDASMIADDAAAYLNVGESVVRVDAATGDLLTLFRETAPIPPDASTFSAFAFAVDAQFLYVADWSGIYRVAK
jgi:hypothetical protein